MFDDLLPEVGHVDVVALHLDVAGVTHRQPAQVRQNRPALRTRVVELQRAGVVTVGLEHLEGAGRQAGNEDIA